MILIPIRLCIRVLYNSDGFKLQYRIFFGFIRVKKSSNEEEEQELKSKKVKKKKKKTLLAFFKPFGLKSMTK